MTGKVKVTVPATTANLGAGCDCIGLALSLYNTVTFEVTGAGLTVAVSGEGAGLLPLDENNTVIKAAKRLWNEVGFPAPEGLKITLENSIPVGAGLGSSAAAIIGGLAAANFFAGAKLSSEEILSLAAAVEGHPDNVAAAFLGGSVVAAREGNGVVALKFSVAEEVRVVAAVPDFQVATASAREVLPEVYPRGDSLYNVGRAALLAGAFAVRRYDLLKYGMDDRLYQPYRAPLVPGLEEVLRAAVAAGALGAALSGAGPTVVALATDKTDIIGGAMVKAFNDAGVRTRIFLLAPDNRGTRIES